MDPGSTAYRDDIGEWLPAQRHTGKTSRVVDLDPGSEAYRDDGDAWIPVRSCYRLTVLTTACQLLANVLIANCLPIFFKQPLTRPYLSQPHHHSNNLAASAISATSVIFSRVKKRLRAFSLSMHLRAQSMNFSISASLDIGFFRLHPTA